MPSKFGGVPVEEETRKSRFGGVAVDASPTTRQSVVPAPAASPQQTPTALLPVVAEAAGAINRGVANIADAPFDLANTATSLLGIEGQLPRPANMALEAATGGTRNFMEPGTARDVVQAAGENIPGLASVARGAQALNTPRTTVQLADDAAAAARVPLRRAAVKQGFDEGVVNMVSESGANTKAQMRRMLNTFRSGRNKPANINRPSDVVGEVISRRAKTVLDANKKAGRRLNAEARRLQGGRVDLTDAKNVFLDALEDQGVQVSDDLSLSFKGSTFEDIKVSENFMKVLVRRLDKVDDALSAHRLKKFIDENVDFGDSGSGISGRAESIAKSLRRAIDQSLDARFPSYKEANDQFSETVGVLNDLQTAAGKKISLVGPNADKALGSLARTVFSNNRGRQEVINSLKALDDMAVKYGDEAGENLDEMIAFSNEIDRVFGPQAKTSLLGDVARAALTEGTAGAARAGVRGAINQSSRVNEQRAVAAMRELLEN